MATIWVNSNNTGTQNGLTEATGYRTIATIPSIPAGDTVEFSVGSGPYIEVFDLTSNGTLANPITWNVNGCEVSLKVLLTDPAEYNWTPSVLGGNIYYCTKIDGTTTGYVTGTGIANNQIGSINGQAVIASTGANLKKYQWVLPTTITMNNQLARGDADSLGFNTFYVRCDEGNPIGNQTIYCAKGVQNMFAAKSYHIINDAIISYANEINARCTSLSWTFNRCIFAYADSNGVGITNATVSEDNVMRLNNCLFYWTGHRSAAIHGGVPKVYLDHCTAVGSHLFALIDNPTTAGALLTVTNCIGAYLQAGGIDNKKLDTAYLVETNNFWYPLFNEATSGLAYVSLAGWPNTDATDIPASRAGDDGVAANYIPPNFVRYSENGYWECDFRLADNESGASTGGVRNWTSTGRRNEDFSGEPYSDYEISMGYLQSKITPSHPLV